MSVIHSTEAEVQALVDAGIEVQPLFYDSNGNPVVDLTSLGADLDGNGIIDNDFDGDGVHSTRDPDDNNSSLQFDYDFDGIDNSIDSDDDNDGLSDVDEIALGTNPSITDTDLDGFGDSTEVNILNTDPLDGTTVIIDSDGDGLSDNDEINNIGTDPNNADTDNDGATDPIDLSPLDNQISGIDTDLDGIDDAWANFFYPSGLNLTNDLDGDSLTVLQEYVSQTSDDYFNERQIIQALSQESNLIESLESHSAIRYRTAIQTCLALHQNPLSKRCLFTLQD